MVTAKQAYWQTKDRLQRAGIEEAGAEARLLLHHCTGLDRFSDRVLSSSALIDLATATERRAERYPLQYILGRWPFLELELLVGEGVLIPRPETEEVCLAAVERLRGIPKPAVLDLCAGSGALALGIQSRVPDARVSAVELEAAAFGWLRRNVDAFAASHPAAPRAVQADAVAFCTGLAGASVDLVVSNPPYVTEAEYAALAPELRCEPKAALVAGEEGLFFYRALAAACKAKLKPGGHLVLEIGAGQGAAVAGILEQNGYRDVTIQKDLAGHDRIAAARA